MFFLPNHEKLKSIIRPLGWAVAILPVLTAVQFAAFWLRFEGQLGPEQLEMIRTTLVWVLLVKVAVFGWFGLLRSWSRCMTFHDLMTVCKAATVSSLILVLGYFLIFPDVDIPRSVFLMDWGVTIAAVGSLRSVTRLMAEREPPLFMSYGKSPVFIVGANDSGEALLRSIRRNRSLSYRVVGFITDDSATLRSRIDGVPVIGQLDQTAGLAEQYGVSDVLITAGELPGRSVRRLVEDCRRRGVEVKVLPSYEQLLHGSMDVRPRTVSIEDLLHRDPVQLDMRAMHQWIHDRVLLVTGSAGSIGSEICRQLIQFSPRKMILIDRSENGQFYLERELRHLGPAEQIDVMIGDIDDHSRMEHVFKTHRPDIVFHAAAYKHVPLMESNPGEAVKNICLATRTLADLADQNNVGSFVMISTDKAVRPTSIMGTCKRVAEIYVQALSEVSSCRFVTVRFGNVLDSAGSVVPIFRDQIAKGGPVTVTHPEMHRYFMTIPEASQLVIQAGAMGNGGEIFVLRMGEPVRIADLASDMIRLSGLREGEDIEIEFTGIRPGEKLFEELYTEREQHVPTAHGKIMIAVCQTRSIKEMNDVFEQLERLSHDPGVQLIDQLRTIVPEYHSGDVYVARVRQAA